jgi:hypothetical protein
MAATRRDRNKNFFKWEPVEEGNNRFTRNAPLNWFYEIIETVDLCPSEEEEWCAPDIGALRSQEDIFAAGDLASLTPTNAELLRAAEMFPPPPEWFEEDEERPF